MIGPAFTIAAVLALSATVDAARCRYTKDKLPGKIEKYNKCLSIGFDPSIEGCVKVVREGHKLRRNDNRKCAELERYLMKCGHMCAAPVDGGWSDFGDWSECSAECDGGDQTRDRQCDNPAPDHGGADCEGEDSETQECNTDPCPAPRRLSLRTGERRKRRGGGAGTGLTGNNLYRGGRLYCYKCVKTANKAEDCTSNMCFGDCATIEYSTGAGQGGSVLTSSQIRLCAPNIFSDDELCKIYSHYNLRGAGTTCSVARCSTYLCNNGEPAIRWRLDRKCGSGYRLPNNTRAECDPDGEFPCCSRASYGVCGNTAFHCTGAGSTDYRAVKRWREAGEPLMRWRFDRLCGSENLLPDGTVSECDPDGKYPCCSDSTNGKCGGKKHHCMGLEAIDFRLIKQWREEVGGSLKRNRRMLPPLVHIESL